MEYKELRWEWKLRTDQLQQMYDYGRWELVSYSPVETIRGLNWVEYEHYYIFKRTKVS